MASKVTKKDQWRLPDPALVRHLDAETLSIRQKISAPREPPPLNHISILRAAFGLSLADLAKRCRASGKTTSVSRKTIHQLEKNERSRKIGIESLDRVAAAMGCHVVVMVLPAQPTFAHLAGWYDPETRPLYERNVKLSRRERLRLKKLREQKYGV